MTAAASVRYPTITPVGDTGLLVEFGDRLDEEVWSRVLAFDARVHADLPPGVLETVPSYAAVMLVYDPLLTDPDQLAAAAGRLLASHTEVTTRSESHVVPVCYEGDGAPDLAEAAKRLGMSEEALIAAHLGGDYRVFMYGFAPGYAYMGGVPDAIRLPRKSEPVRSRPVGSVMIAGGQCLVTTLPMPTGWWVIGLSPFQILRPDDEKPFVFEVGDRIRFQRISRDELAAAGRLG